MPKVVLKGIMALGGGLLLLAAYFYTQEHQRLSAFAYAPAVVVSKEIRSVRVNSGVVKRFFHPMVTFKPTPDAEEPMTLALEEGSETREFDLNDHITLMYPKGEPKRAKAFRWVKEYLKPLAVALAGMLLIVFAWAFHTDNAKQAD